MVLVNLSFVNAQGPDTYEAYDEYKNLVFTLVLQPDKTYTFNENFLDGSVWKDEGTWVQIREQRLLTSSKKTKRAHNYLTFKSSFKFKGDAFKVVGDTLVYAGKGNQKANDYFKKLQIVKVKKDL